MQKPRMNAEFRVALTLRVSVESSLSSTLDDLMSAAAKTAQAMAENALRDSKNVTFERVETIHAVISYETEH